MPLGINLAAVEPRAPFLFTNDVIGGLSLEETGLHVRITGFQIRMVLLGELAIRLADLIRGRIARNAKNFIGIFRYELLPICGSHHIT
jgi:hypothetical protein